MLFLLEDKGFRGQRPSKSKTIEEQSRFFRNTSESWVSRSEIVEEQDHRRAITFFHGYFGELGVRDHRRARPPKSNHVFLWTLRRAGTSESWKSKSKTIEEQLCFFMDISESWCFLMNTLESWGLFIVVRY